MTRKDEIINDINDLLDSLSPARAKEILSKLNERDLLDLEIAIRTLRQETGL